MVGRREAVDFTMIFRIEIVIFYLNLEDQASNSMSGVPREQATSAFH
jgi:hypothetical protein